ncbi:MAG: hypothetical protein AB1689_06345 [Thermodesulfobacteriota bacterium]
MARGGGEVGLLEEIAANAVAASGVQLVDGWLLRAWPEAPFRRSNAVLPIRCDPGSLDERLVLVEEFYRRHGLPVRYQISPAVEPADLDAVLAARGYFVEAPVLVQVARAADVAARTRRDAPRRAASSRRRRATRPGSNSTPRRRTTRGSARASRPTAGCCAA